MYFEKILLLGSGKIACDCAQILSEKEIQYNVIESQYSQVSMLKRLCDKLNILYCCEENASKLKEKILENIVGQTLIISANNEYIFPKEIINLEGVTIINFHYSYLPDYRGMNIPTWVIYNEEKYTGITWHYVNPGIDAGEIIIQKKIPLDGSETALQVVKSVMQQGKAAFEEFIDEFLEEPICGKANEADAIHCYRRKQLPQDGYLDVNAESAQIIKLLRAFDYGPLQIIPKLKIQLEGEEFEIERYRIVVDDQIKMGKQGWISNYSLHRDELDIELYIKKEE